jgi:NAD(P)-dependent dehydrogenase (short-subunit alcohol dehydrogenase family)
MFAHFTELGMKVAAADIDASAVEESVALAGGAAVAHVVDVADDAAVAALAAAVYDRWGAAHLVCNNAGVFQAGLSWTRSRADWQWALDVNLFGIINGINAFVPRMLAAGQPGHVVNTSSVAGFISAPMTGPYNVSKAAAFSVTECLAHDLAATGAAIGASVLCPSAIRTGIAHTDRVRPGGPIEEGDDASVVRTALAGMTDAGIEPAEVPPIVVQGVRAGDFLIATKPSYRDQLTTRFEALVERRLPPTPAVD